MTDNDLSCGVDALAPARGDAAPTHMPRSESPSRLAGLLPTREVRGRNNRATDKDEGTRNTLNVVFFASGLFSRCFTFKFSRELIFAIRDRKN